MRRLILWNLVTPDGYFDGAEPWSIDGHEQVWGEELGRFSFEQAASADLLLFGRVPYEGMARHWREAVRARSRSSCATPLRSRCVILKYRARERSRTGTTPANGGVE